MGFSAIPLAKPHTDADGFPLPHPVNHAEQHPHAETLHDAFRQALRHYFKRSAA